MLYVLILMSLSSHSFGGGGSFVPSFSKSKRVRQGHLHSTRCEEKIGLEKHNHLPQFGKESCL